MKARVNNIEGNSSISKLNLRDELDAEALHRLIHSEDVAVRIETVKNLTLPFLELLNIIDKEEDWAVYQAARESFDIRQSNYSHMLSESNYHSDEMKKIVADINARTYFCDDMSLIGVLLSAQNPKADHFVMVSTLRPNTYPYVEILARMREGFYAEEERSSIADAIINNHSADRRQILEFRDAFNSEEKNSFIKSLNIRPVGGDYSHTALWLDAFSLFNEEASNELLPDDYKIRLAKLMYLSEI